MKTLKKLSALLLAAVLAPAAFALPYLNGTLDTSGATATLNTPNLDTAGSAVINTNGFATAASTGVYTSVIGSTVTFSDFAWAPFSVSNPVWSVSGITFTLQSLAKQPGSNSAFLNLSGTGFASAAGYENTHGVFTLTITDSSPSANVLFSFNTSTTTVPDAGSSSILLGLGLIGLAAVRRLRK